MHLRSNFKSFCRRKLRIGRAHPNAYDQDGLRTVHNHEFMNDPAFVAAYDRGVQAAGDYPLHWRCHVGLWVAATAARLKGSFVECGVNYGFLSSAIMKYLDWNSRQITFYLFDTFAGLDGRFVSDEEQRAGSMARSRQWLQSGKYVSGVDSVRQNFSEWKNVEIIQGTVPESLARVEIESVAYLHLDMNCAPPEIAAAEYFWPRMTPGAMMLLDDYAYSGYRPQKVAMDQLARRKGVQVLSLPTGQGLVVHP